MNASNAKIGILYFSLITPAKQASNQMSGFIFYFFLINNHLVDEEFKEATSMLFQRLENNDVRFVVSDLLDLWLLWKRNKPKF